MAKIMQPQSTQLRVCADRPPASGEAAHTAAFGVSREQKRIGVARTGQRNDVRPRGLVERYRTGAGLATRKVDCVGPDVSPAQIMHFAPAASGDERVAMGDALPALGGAIFEIYLNGEAFWRNVPTAVWTYRVGGYQLLKRWLSYRERDIIGRLLIPEEVQEFAELARRIGAILIWNIDSR